MSVKHAKGLIQFRKAQTATATAYLIRCIAKLAESEIEQAGEIINDLSIVLAVMRKCHEAAPEIPSLPTEKDMKPKYHLHQLIKTNRYLPPLVTGTQAQIIQIVNKGKFIRYQVQDCAKPENKAWTDEDDLEPPLL